MLELDLPQAVFFSLASYFRVVYWRTQFRRQLKVNEAETEMQPELKEILILHQEQKGPFGVSLSQDL